MVKIIINADDFGLIDCVNGGIVDSYINGILTSATLMMNTDATEEAVKLAKKHNIPTGIHLNLNFGRPLSKLQDCRTLVDIQRGKFFNSAYEVINRIQTEKIKLAEIENEYHNQFSVAADYGIKLTHIDSHKHLHHFLPVYRIVEKLAMKFNIKKIRIAAEYNFNAALDKYVKFGDNDFAYQLYIQHCKTNGLYKSVWFGEPYNFAGFFYAGKMSIEKFIEIYNRIKNSELPVEIMCHPSYNFPQLSEISSLTIQREIELNALKSEDLKKIFNKEKRTHF